MYSTIKLSVLVFLIGLTTSAFAQSDIPPPVWPDPQKPNPPELSKESEGISGFRFGVVRYIDIEELGGRKRENDPPVPFPFLNFGYEDINHPETLSLVGYHFESIKEIRSSSNKLILQGVFLVAGLGQGWAIPSGSLLFGMRSPKYYEISFGGNFSQLDPSIVIACGKTFKYDNTKIPLNLSASISSDNVRIMLTTGFVVKSTFIFF
jgi:hypothetical protein